MRRILFNVAAALSLLMFIATAVSFARTRGWIEWVEYETGSRWYRIVGRPAGVFLSTAQHAPLPGESRWSFDGQGSSRWDFSGYRRVLGFSAGSFYYGSQPPLQGTVHYLLLPYWFVALATGALPALWALLWWRRRHARAPGLCATCGYDLRASTDRCPECGAPIPAAAPAEPLPAA